MQNLVSVHLSGVFEYLWEIKIYNLCLIYSVKCLQTVSQYLKEL